MSFSLENIVYTVLLKNKQTRKDDFILVLEVIREYCPSLIEMKIKDIMLEHKELGLPSFESITRARRKVQKEHTELIDKDAKKIRKELQKEYKNYYVG
ncbi:MAG: hypothetical protein IJV15_00120 [Lachnospiraceae bacterium]|nr:hypothetical protein [Lachnospiraceae bacterium]